MESNLYERLYSMEKIRTTPEEVKKAKIHMINGEVKTAKITGVEEDYIAIINEDGEPEILFRHAIARIL